MTGAGTIDLGTKQIGFRVEPKLVMTTEGQGRAADPVGLGIPVMIEGPWAQPRIYPEMQGILDNPDAAYAKLKEMGKGLFGAERRAALVRAFGGLLGGGQQGGRRRQARRRTGRHQPGDLLGGQLGETLGNLLQQGLRRHCGQSRRRAASRPQRPRQQPAQHPAGPRTPNRRRRQAVTGGRATPRPAAERCRRPAGQPADERGVAAAFQPLKQLRRLRFHCPRIALRAIASPG